MARSGTRNRWKCVSFVFSAGVLYDFIVNSGRCHNIFHRCDGDTIILFRSPPTVTHTRYVQWRNICLDLFVVTKLLRKALARAVIFALPANTLIINKQKISRLCFNCYAVSGRENKIFAQFAYLCSGRNYC